MNDLVWIGNYLVPRYMVFVMMGGVSLTLLTISWILRKVIK